MKIAQIAWLFNNFENVTENHFNEFLRELLESLNEITYPEGSENFKLNPIRKGNGVNGIKQLATNSILARFPTMKTEETIIDTGSGRKSITDFLYKWRELKIAMEWETGNISSSHRSINRMMLAMYQNNISAGILILPSKLMYNYLTDRVGNYDELSTYFPIYSKMTLEDCGLVVVAIEYDELDETVPLFTKGKDGNAEK